MTPAQSMRREGFLASLDVRGTPLSVTIATVTTNLVALVQPVPPDEGEFSSGKNERESSVVHILREQVPTGLVIGSVFTDSSALVRHRITKIKDDATNIAVVFTCESAPYTP